MINANDEVYPHDNAPANTHIPLIDEHRGYLLDKSFHTSPADTHTPIAGENTDSSTNGSPIHLLDHTLNIYGNTISNGGLLNTKDINKFYKPLHTITTNIPKNTNSPLDEVTIDKSIGVGVEFANNEKNKKLGGTQLEEDLLARSQTVKHNESETHPSEDLKEIFSGLTDNSPDASLSDDDINTLYNNLTHLSNTYENSTEPNDLQATTTSIKNKTNHLVGNKNIGKRTFKTRYDKPK